jgi:hypothetical protein
MVAGWNANGARIGWPLPSQPGESDIDAQTNAPDIANEAIYANLAVRLAPAFGKVVLPELKQLANTSYSNLLNQIIDLPPERQMPSTMSQGAGNKPWRNFNSPFVRPPQENLETGADNIILE